MRNDLRQRARAALEALRDESGETVLLVVPDIRRFVVVDALEQSKQHSRRRRMLEGATIGALPGDFMLMRQPHVFIAYVHEHCAFVGGGESTDSADLRGLKL